MKWFITLLVLGAINAALTATIKKIIEKEPPANCTEFFASYKQQHLDTKRILGTWYHVGEESEQMRCLHFEKLSVEYRKTLAEELKPYANKTDFNRFSLILKKSCVSIVNYNDTDFLLLEHINKGVFDAYYIPQKRSDIHMIPLTVLIRLLEVNGKEYLGLLPCLYLAHDDYPDVFEKRTGITYTAEEVRDLEIVFKDNRILV